MKTKVINRDYDLVAQYCLNNSTEVDEVLHELERETYLKTLAPQMISGYLQGKFLEMIASVQQSKNILEVGTFTGYATICLARGVAEGGMVHTIEINPELKYISDKYFKLAQVEDRIIQYIGDANEVIPNLEEEFDLAFLDGAKPDYCELYPIIKSKLKKGGMLLVDNVLWGGKMAMGNMDKASREMQKFNDEVKTDEEVEMIILPVRDGLMMVKKL